MAADNILYCPFLGVLDIRLPRESTSFPIVKSLATCPLKDRALFSPARPLLLHSYPVQLPLPDKRYLEQTVFLEKGGPEFLFCSFFWSQDGFAVPSPFPRYRLLFDLCFIFLVILRRWWSCLFLRIRRCPCIKKPPLAFSSSTQPGRIWFPHGACPPYFPKFRNLQTLLFILGNLRYLATTSRASLDVSRSGIRKRRTPPAFSCLIPQLSSLSGPFGFSGEPLGTDHFLTPPCQQYGACLSLFVFLSVTSPDGPPVPFFHFILGVSPFNGVVYNFGPPGRCSRPPPRFFPPHNSEGCACWPRIVT